ncbi:hypothetical protein ACVCNR_22895 (plasmid) [Aquamicrobium terrae]
MITSLSQHATTAIGWLVATYSVWAVASVCSGANLAARGCATISGVENLVTVETHVISPEPAGFLDCAGKRMTSLGVV